MRGRRTSEEKIQGAYDLREKGFSVREIAKRLRVSKSAVQRFTRDVPLEALPEPEEAEAEEPPAAPATLPNRYDSEMAELWRQLLDIKYAAEFAFCDGDEDALRKLESKLMRLQQKGSGYISRFGRRI